MADASTDKAPAFVRALLLKQPEERLEILKQSHPDYDTHSPSWTVLLDAFEGRGGFLDGGYLWAYAREDANAFGERKKWARYHNYLETLVDLYVRFVFTQGVKRTSKSAEYDKWTENVDGAGTALTPFLKQFVSMSLVCGHAGVLVDKTSEEPEGVTLADEKARVIASIFAATSIKDWRYLNNEIEAVKLCEAAPATDILEKLEQSEDNHQYLLWNREGWARFSAKGDYINGGTPDIGIVPLVVMRPKASQTSRMLGRALVSNANVVKALFNRTSEEDEVLRAQAFSVLTLELDSEANLEEAKASLGNVLGTAKALVAKGKIKYETPDQNVPGTIRDNIAYLVQEMYRAAHVKFNRDSLAAQSGESIRLQYTELNEMLQGLAKALAQAEREIARAWFAWMHPTEEQAQKAFEDAAPTAEYPDEFFLDDLLTDLQAWAEAIAMNLGETMTKRIKKRAVRRVEPDMPEADLKKVDEEIDNLPTEELLPPLSRQPPDDGSDNGGFGG